MDEKRTDRRAESERTDGWTGERRTDGGEEDVEDTIEAVAQAAVAAGAAELEARFGTTPDAEYGTHDVKADADVAAERRMLPVVRQAFPDHEVYAEETGTFPGTAPYRWIIDPLDGTNDFAAGLPTFATSVAVLRSGEPILATLSLPATGETYRARVDEGVRYDGRTVTAESDRSLAAGTVAMIVGREVPRDDDRARTADAIRDAIGGECKRVLDSWAPTVHSGLFARGRLQGLVEFHPDEEERAVTELLAREAAASRRRDGPLSIAAADGETLDRLWTAVDEVR